MENQLAQRELDQVKAFVDVFVGICIPFNVSFLFLSLGDQGVNPGIRTVFLGCFVVGNRVVILIQQLINVFPKELGC